MRRAFFSLALIAAFSGPALAAAFTPDRMLTDFEQVKRELAERAPNLEWSIAERGLDLAKLASDADTQIRAATTEDEARAALRNFLIALGDGHISLQFPDEKPVDDQAWGTASICRGLGYEDEQRSAGMPLERLGARAVTTDDSAVFPIHVADLPGGKLGILRIPSFYEWGYYQYCPLAVAEIGLPANGECDESCGAAIGQKAAQLLTEAVARQIETLKAEGVVALAVDITQNGGGSLWLDPVARMLTPIKLKAPRLAFTRTQSWRDALASHLAGVDADLANAVVGVAYRGVLNAARETLVAALAEAMKPCDRSGIWANQMPDCSLIVPGKLYATGIEDYAPPGEYSLLSSGYALFFSSLYAYDEGVWSGPLYVVMDEGSASAAEHFATLLKDNHAAVLIGEPTFGAGCGWMSNGDVPIVLEESRAELHVPDCIWTNAAGENEVGGIEPDISVPWRFYDNAFQKGRRLMTALKALDFAAWPPGQTPPPPTVGKSPAPR
ncbi:MAG: S41 family peptidase [Micropepsaceae bacterium]